MSAFIYKEMPVEKHHKFSVWYVLLGIWIVFIIHNYLAAAFSIRTIPYSEFVKLLKEEKVAEISIGQNVIQGRMIDGETGKGNSELFKTIRVDPEISKQLEEFNVTFKGQMESTFIRDLFSWIFP